MPIWSLTAERLEKLKDALAKKKAEHDELLALSEKDLWCRDLDDFVEEWEHQDQLDREIQTDIRRMGRRASKKIGAGRSKKVKAEDAWEPEKKKAKAKAAPTKKPETKTAQRFAEMFNSTKPTADVKKEVKSEVMDLDDDNFSDDDFAALSRSKPPAKASSKPPAARSMSTLSQSEEPEPSRNKRVAASKAKTLFDLDSESDLDNDLLGDVGNMVKGIGKDSGEPSGRLSLHAMSRPESSHGHSSSGGLPKPKSRSRVIEDDSMDDESNYEKLAKSSPFKAPAKGDDIDEFLSDDEPMAAPSKPAAKPAAKPAPTVAGLSEVKKARGRPTGAKAKPAAAKKQTTLSPAAKAYALKKAVKKSVLEDDSDEEMAGSPSPRPAARGRPGRAAAAKKAPVVDVDSSMQDSSMNVDEEDEESDDPFDMDDD